MITSQAFVKIMNRETELGIRNNPDLVQEEQSCVGEICLYLMF